MMRVHDTLATWLERRRRLERFNTVGFVPTMGALHVGHASLVERCRRENDLVVVSIFVNPTQFNDPKDLDRYPRTLESDLALLERLGADDVLMPSAAELYPDGYRLRVETADNPVMESRFRPGFLQGVMTIVLKLFNIVRADRAYFGEKDYQQLLAVRDIALEFFTGTEVVACPTVREASGLAESSRNRLLSPEAKNQAASIYRLLTSASTPAAARAALESNGFIVDYVEEHWGRRFAAAFLDGVRLIDNTEVPCS